MTAVPPTGPDTDVAARCRGAALLSAVLVLLLFVAGGAAATMAAPVAQHRVELVGEHAALRAGLAVAVEGAAAPRALALAVAAAAAPRVVPRCRQVQSRGLPPPRAPTA
ncbi:MAG: hypothetical protein IT455_04640 [Planctomycetes bacterium]|nr:hypothetical protein [Planctomycetota bacterium]